MALRKGKLFLDNLFECLYRIINKKNSFELLLQRLE